MMFHWADFAALLSPSVIAMAVSVGLVFGVVTANVNHRVGALFYWMAAGGVTFIVPLAVIRAIQGAETWERWFSALLLWLLYVGAAHASDWLTRRLPTRTP